MELFLYLIVQSVDIFLSFVILAMLVRSIMSLFMIDEDNKWFLLVYTVTEPFVFPLRNLFERMEWFRGSPIDVSYFCSAMLILLVQTALSFIPIG